MVAAWLPVNMMSGENGNAAAGNKPLKQETVGVSETSIVLLTRLWVRSKC